MCALALAVDGPVCGGYTAPDGQTTLLFSPMTGPTDDVVAESDEALARRLLDRDVRALEAVYEQHSRPVFSLALKLLSDYEAAEEIVQETFLKLWQRPDSYAPQRGRMLSWLLGVAHHRAVDRLRRRRLELRHSTNHQFADVASAPGDPQDELLASLRGEAVGRALRQLPTEQRLAVELAYLRGMTQAEIAELLGEPLGTVKTRLRLAMQKLRASAELAEMRLSPQ
jgi:RNA polymerase sigma-70 factor, ECF subfamily